MSRAKQTHLNRSTPPSHSHLQRAPKDVMVPRLMVILSAAALLVIGLVMVFSASSVTAFVEQGDAYGETIKQVFFAVAGIIFCIGIAKFLGLRGLSAAPVIYGFWAVCVLGVLATAAFGTTSLGAKRWLYIGPFSIQIAEFLKIALVLVSAHIMVEFNEGAEASKVLLKVALLVVMPLCLLFFLQSDLGTTIICLIAIFSILILGGVPARYLIAMVVLIGALGAAAIFMTPYRAARVFSFMDPWADASGEGYQIVHSLKALASGGIFGVGLGGSYEKLQYLPEAETDFIFAIIGEELGLLGAAAVVVLFIVLLCGGYSVAKSAPSSYGMLIAGALTTMIVAQAFINILCVIGFFPITGKPLPFISAGGSSLISSLWVIGVILAVSYSSEPTENAYRERRDNLHVISSYSANQRRR